MILAVMQPTYLPWMGYFDLIDQSDVFIFYDTVQFSKQSWQQRNLIKTFQGKQWLTVPVYQSWNQTINEVRIAEIDGKAIWRKKHWKSIYLNYQKTPFWSTYGPSLAKVYLRKWEKLAELNIHLIHLFCGWLGIHCKFVCASELPLLPSEKIERLIGFCKMFGADTYLSPPGSREYLGNGEGFQKGEISLKYQNYDPRAYPQLYGEFIPQLSVVDLLMNTGPEAIAVIRSGRRPWRKPEENGI